MRRGSHLLAFLLLCAALPCANALLPSRASPRLVRPATARTAACRPLVTVSCMADDDELRARDLSRELKKYETNRLRVTQSGPVRRLLAGAVDARDGLFGMLGFYRFALDAVPVNRALLVLTLLAFGVQQYVGQAATLAGARFNVAIDRGGQWHRLVTPIFLHGGWLHLLSNCFSLFRIGPLVEGAYGAARCLLLYLLAGIGGNVAGLIWGSARGMSVGASGAVLGLMGATAAFVVRNKRALGGGGDALLSQVVQILFINLLIGTRAGSGVDNLGHVGGAATGFVLGLAVAPAVGRRSGAGGDDGGDGSLVPAPVTQALLLATLLVVGVALRDGARLATVLRPRLR